MTDRPSPRASSRSASADTADGQPIRCERAADIVREIAKKNRAPHILKQLDGIRTDRIVSARRRYARDMTDDEMALVLVDTSFLQNGASGFLLTNRAIYSRWLSRPIALQHVDRVSFLTPTPGAIVGLYVAVLFICVFPPLSLFLLPMLWPSGRRHLQNRLSVNDEIVYAGGKSLNSGFWLEVLPALAEGARRLARENRVKVIEVVSSGDTEPVTADAENWAMIESTLRSLDGTTLRSVRLWTGAPDQSRGLEVLGGNGRYVLRELGGTWTYYDPDAGEEEIEVGAGDRFPAYLVCTSLDRAVAIARSFAQAGAFD